MDIFQTEHELEMCNEENEKLKKQNQKLREALEEIYRFAKNAEEARENHPDTIVNPTAFKELAQQALEGVDNDEA